MKEQILSIINKVTKIDTAELLAKENEAKLWDSLTHVELIIMLEEELDIFFEQDEIAEMGTVAKILDVIGRKMA